jgi:hypothetical protein
MSFRHVVKTVAATSAATFCGAALVVGLGAGPAGASTLTSADGNTTLSTTGTVTAGSPYSSGQAITIKVAANSTLNNTNLVANNVPGQSTGNPTGNYYIAMCTDPGGLPANLPTGPSNCEVATQDVSVSTTSDGSFTDTGFQVFTLPNAALGSPTMTGTCGTDPNECVIGIFSQPPGTTGFNFPRLFSAPFQVKVPPTGGANSGASPGDGTPEVPLAIGLPLAALAVVGGWTIRNRRRSRQQQAVA